MPKSRATPKAVRARWRNSPQASMTPSSGYLRRAGRISFWALFAVVLVVAWHWLACSWMCCWLSSRRWRSAGAGHLQEKRDFVQKA
nr:MAG TPA: hypothetical protein [Caudoviricetes sp.]